MEIYLKGNKWDPESVANFAAKIKETTLEELSLLADLCQRKKITKLASGDFTIEFGDRVIHKRKRRHLEPSTTPDTPELTEEDILFWSSPGLSEDVNKGV